MGCSPAAAGATATVGTIGTVQHSAGSTGNSCRGSIESGLTAAATGNHHRCLLRCEGCLPDIGAHFGAPAAGASVV